MRQSFLLVYQYVVVSPFNYFMLNTCPSFWSNNAIAFHSERLIMTDTNMKSTGFLRLPSVLRLIPVARSTWWAGVKSGRFPAPVKLGPRTTAWRVEDIRDLIEAIGR